jgi:hypothetical protein
LAEALLARLFKEVVGEMRFPLTLPVEVVELERPETLDSTRQHLKAVTDCNHLLPGSTLITLEVVEAELTAVPALAEKVVEAALLLRLIQQMEQQTKAVAVAVVIQAAITYSPLDPAVPASSS